VCTKDGVEIERDHTPGSFITMGLELEQVQYVLLRSRVWALTD
jgi:hypothetical protein